MAVKAGECDMGLAVGVEKLAGAGLLAGGARSQDADTWQPTGRYGAVAPVDGRIGTETMPGVFAQIGMEYGHRYGGVDFELFAKISEKNHAHSTLNPLASYQKRFTLDEIMNDVMIAYPNTRPMCSANCDGAAAAVVVSDAKLKTLSLAQQQRAVKVAASVLTTDPWEEACQILPNVNTLTRNAAKQAYEHAGVGPEDLDLVELHDCFATAELVHYDNLMLCEQGGAADFFRSGATWRDGKTPVNVSGGLESKGHPIAATGIANIWEVCHHLRGEAGDRQIEGASVGLAHVIGLGSACGVHILERCRGVIEFAGRDGNRLAADVAGDPADPPAVLLHGGGQTRHSWGTTLGALADKGWRAYAVDLRGHGDSEWAADGDYTLDAFAGDVLAISRALDTAAGARRRVARRHRVARGDRRAPRRDRRAGRSCSSTSRRASRSRAGCASARSWPST